MAVTINGTNGLTFNNSSTQDVGGVGTGGQTWQNVTASRAENVTYTNTSGKPIMVSVSAITTTITDGYADMNITVDGNTIAYNTATSRGSNKRSGCTVIVPVGSTYSSAWSGNLISWYELR